MSHSTLLTYCRRQRGSPLDVLLTNGYFNREKDEFLDAIAVDTVAMLRALAQGSLRYISKENDRRQTFLAIKFGELERCGVVTWRMPRRHIA